jgi:uncharacterized protein YcsI (UPF0317 family)
MTHPITLAQSARLAMRTGQWTHPTKHTLPGYAKCNLVIVPQAQADDMLLYCRRNPLPCPLLEMTPPGDPRPIRLAPDADLRTDLSRYAIYIDGHRQADCTDIRHLWRDDLVSFLIGSGTTWDPALEAAGIPRGQTWLYQTSLQTTPAGPIHGPMVVTMRLMTPAHARLAAQITAGFPKFHGAPIHTGSPEQIGVDLAAPLIGTPPEPIAPTHTPVFWACGVTPQAAAQKSRLPFMITHAPTHAFITDLTLDQAALL